MYDVIIVGGGPGGYIAAERAGALGKSVLLIEKEFLGGTCLNWGCIPTKTLLNSAKLYTHALEGEHFGVHAKEVRYDWPRMMAWKNDVIGKLRAGIASMMKRFKVTVIEDSAVVLGPGKVRTQKDGQVHEGKNILIATGSRPAMPPIPGTQNNPKIKDSTGLLELDKVPTSLTVIGGGVIGLEFAGLFATLGTKVQVIEMLDEVIPFMDKDQAPLLRKAMKGVDFALGCKVTSVDGGKVHYTDPTGKAQISESDIILVAVGRRANLQGIGLEDGGIAFTPKGIETDQYMRTNIPGIYAVGDVTGKSLLAHSASRMGEVAVSAMFAGDSPSGAAGATAPGHGASPATARQTMRYWAVPWVVYTNPEAAGVGLTEAEATAKGHQVASATLPLTMSGRFLAEQGPAGVGKCKVLADKKDGRILGIHMVGAGVSEIIWGAATFIEMEMTVWEAREIIFPHPTVSEVIRDTLWELSHKLAH
ncbi:MAG: dihydrolipoyl dehydrogenase [Spirochaetales bacterium]|nr:dihydrolipoyl dehydrogenase [Spirochaetales bacterium]